MNEVIVYHGGTEIVERPICNMGRANLDFGRGLDEAKNFDYIEGGVTNDRVVDTVNLYMAGLMELDTALQRLSQHRPNNQICLLNQEITDKYLIYNGTETI